MSDGEMTVDGYQLISCIASGNFSQVWEASDSVGGEHVALKILLPDARKDPEQVRVLKHEARVMKSLDHPAFVRLKKLVASKKNAYIAMDYFRAPNAKTQLQNDLFGLQSRMSRLVESICLALAYMHGKGWLHRDIKPDNILFNKAGEMRLIDFSLSCRSASGIGKLLAGKPKNIQGTRTYIAPETLMRKPATEQTDMYSLGVSLFEMLTGAPPFTGLSPKDLLMRHLETKPPAPSAINPNVTAEMDRLILKLLAKKPKDRYKDMNEVYAEFRGLKIFKEDPLELAERQARERKARELDNLGGEALRNSRIDHERSLAAGPDAPRPAAKPKPKAKPKPVPAPAPAARQPASMPVGASPAPMPWPPTAPLPAYAGYAQAPPYAPGPQQPYAPGMPPQYAPGQGMPFPPVYAMPPQQAPPQQAPAPAPPQPRPASAQPVPPPARAPQPAMPAPATPTPAVAAQDALPAPAPRPLTSRRDEERHISQKPGDEDLPTMDELPDIL